MDVDTPRAATATVAATRHGPAPAAGLQFVPLTDALLYDHPERIRGPIVPFTHAVACLHWERVALPPEGEVG